jgi:hypothetical protein
MLSMMKGSSGDSCRALDQLLGLGQALVALGEGIAERVVGMGMVGLERDQLAQIGLQHVVLADLLGEQRRFVEQFGLLRLAARLSASSE